MPQEKGDDDHCTSAPRPQHRRHGYAAAHLGDRRRLVGESRFAIGALAAVLAFFLRRSLAETTSDAVRHQKDTGTIRGILRYPRSFFTVLGFTAGGSLIFYTFTTYMQKYLVNTAGMGM